MLGRRPLLSRRAALGLWPFFSGIAQATEKPGALTAFPPLRDGDQRLYLVRHGETDWNVEKRIQGRTDNALNDNGRAQASALSRYLASEPIDVVTSSNLLRAMQTADAIALAHPEAERVPGLTEMAEMCFGDLEGERLSAIADVYQATTNAWRAGDDRRWPGAQGESPNDVAARGIRGLRSLGLLPPAEEPTGAAASRSASTDAAGRRVAVVAHGRFNKILIAALAGDVTKAGEVEQGNTCVNVLDFAPDGDVTVRALNVQDHLVMAAMPSP